MGNDTVPVPTMTCEMQPQENAETWPGGSGGKLPLWDHFLLPPILAHPDTSEAQVLNHASQWPGSLGDMKYRLRAA